MNTKELKSKATASELTLIEAVESAVRKELLGDVLRELFDWMDKNMPPSRDDLAFCRESGKQWATRLQENLNAKFQ